MGELPSPYVSFGLDASDAPEERIERRADTITIAITVLGVLIAVPALLGLLGGINLSFGHKTNGSVLVTLLDLAYLAAGIGIIFRREQARQLYVVLAVISLIFLAIGSLALATSSARSNVTRESTRIEARIAVLESNPSLPAAVKQRDLEGLHRQAANLPDNSNGGVGGLIPGFLITLVPLVFFTQERVKREFA